MSLTIINNDGIKIKLKYLYAALPGLALVNFCQTDVVNPIINIYIYIYIYI